MEPRDATRTREAYHQYVIVDGKFVGRFEEMYRDVADPWGCTAHVDALPNRILLELLREGDPPRTVLDVGCGLGALTGKIHRVLQSSKMFAFDVSPTAVARARGEVPGVEFFVHDLLVAPELPFPGGSVDLIVMGEVVWYILPVLGEVFREFAQLLTPRGALVLKQAFYPSGVQQYGTEIVASPHDVLRWLHGAGLRAAHQVAVDDEEGTRSWLCRAVAVRAGAAAPAEARAGSDAQGR